MGLALATGRSLRTARFMAGQDLPVPALRRAAELLLSLPDGSFAAVDVAEQLMAEEVARGTLTESELSDRHQRERHQAAVMRAFSVLADLGTVTDLGDHPPLCAVRPGDIPGTERPAGSTAQEGQVIEDAVVRAALTWRTPHRVDVLALDRELARDLPGYRDVADGPAATWELLIDVHDRGLLDVSAAPSHHLVTGLHVHRRAVPAGYLSLMTRRSAGVAEELDRLRAFFDAPDRCAQRFLADYFGVGDLPEGSCAQADCRCSACWNRGDWPRGEHRPAVAEAFAGLRPHDGGGADATLRDHHVDRQVHRLLQLQPRGMHPRRLLHALRGDESAYHAGERRMVPLPESLRASRYFGGRAGITQGQVDESLSRLAAAGRAEQNDRGLWHALSGSLAVPHRAVLSRPAISNQQGEPR